MVTTATGRPASRKRQPRSLKTGSTGFRPRVVVLGDVVVDVVLAPQVELEHGTDVPGRVMLRQGGSGTTTARWLARLGGRVGLVGAVGRDAEGAALLRAIRADGVEPHVVRVRAERTGRIGVLVAPGGERSFVQDRGAVLRLAPEQIRETWFARVALIHVPAYALIGEPLRLATSRAVELAHGAGALVTVDLASSGPLLSLGRERALAAVEALRPDLIFASAGEADALVDGERALLRLAPLVVCKRGSGGAGVMTRSCEFEVPTRPVAATEVTGAGDAFDAGFIDEWLRTRHEGREAEACLRRAAAAGNRVAARHLRTPRRELRLD